MREFLPQLGAKTQVSLSNVQLVPK